jgi:peptidoglycan/LPS O-acetylase OafA/YrhL
MKDSPNFDLLRTVAVGLVLLSHIPDLLKETGLGFNHKAIGRAGVALFFVHTTLVLLMSLDRHGPALGPFLVRRVFRIYPLAIVAVLVMAAAMWAGGQPRSVSEIASNLLLVQNLTGHESRPDPLWTLPYELQMYLLLPALYLFTRGRPLMRIAGIYLGSLAVAAVM